MSAPRGSDNKRPSPTPEEMGKSAEKLAKLGTLTAASMSVAAAAPQDASKVASSGVRGTVAAEIISIAVE